MVEVGLASAVPVFERGRGFKLTSVGELRAPLHCKGLLFIAPSRTSRFYRPRPQARPRGHGRGHGLYLKFQVSSQE